MGTVWVADDETIWLSSFDMSKGDVERCLALQLWSSEQGSKWEM